MIPYSDLVCVTPPGAEISPYSRIRAADAGKAPGVPGRYGWRGYPWREHRPDEAEVQRWARAGANLGLLAGRWPGIDIDVDDPALSADLEAHFVQELGATWRRLSRPPRALLMYSLAGDPVYRHQLIFEWRGERHLIEVLGEGQQYVVQGTHPSGCRYLVERLETPPVSVTARQLIQALDGAQALLEAIGVVVLHRGDAEGQERAVGVDQGSLRGDPELVAAAVAQIPNDHPDRESYITMGYAIKGALGEEGLPVFLEWCERWDGGYNDPEVVEADWGRMDGPFELGAQWIYERAQEAGWGGLARAQFEALEPAPEGGPPAREPEGPHVAPWTDLDLARRLLRHTDGRIRSVPGAGWFVYRDGLWVLSDAEALRMAFSSLSLSAAEALIEERDAKKAMAVVTRCGQLAQANNVLGAAEPFVVAEMDAFDADPAIVGVPSGVLELETGRLRPASSGDLVTARCRVDPGGPAPRWALFLEEATGGDRALAAYLQRLAGYCLSGYTHEHALVFLYGPGGNGKSVFINALLHVLQGYAEVASMDVFMASRSDRHPTELARLRGARLVTASETQSGRRWDEAKVKAITGGEPVAARFMRRDFFTFRPRFKLLLSGNHQPRLSTLDAAWRRRFHLVPFTQRPAVVDPRLGEALEGEAPGILTWMLEGYQMWREVGLHPPAVVLAATDEYFQESDPLGRWMEERCELGPERWTASAKLYDSFRAWARESGEYEQSKRWLSMQLKARASEWGLVYKQGPDASIRARGFYGVGLLESLGAIRFPVEQG